MNHRERVLAAIRHEKVDRLPTDLWATSEIMQKLETYLQVESTIEVYDKLAIDGIFRVWAPYVGPAVHREDDYWEDEWGMGYRWQPYGTGVYDEQVRYPLAQAETIADLEAYAWPSPDWYDYDALPGLCAEYPDRAIICGYSENYYYHWRSRGSELALMDLFLRPELAHYVIKRVSDFWTEYTRRCFEAAPGLIDTTTVGDDWGTQHGLVLSPRNFDEFYRAPMQRAVDLARSYGIPVFHHDDGDMRELLPVLVDVGIDVLNPVQWRSGNWDLQTLKAQYGQRLCFHGGIDNQATLPFGSPSEVRAEVKRLVETLGGDGTGYIIASCHAVQAITPVENVVALFEAAQEYGGLIAR